MLAGSRRNRAASITQSPNTFFGQDAVTCRIRINRSYRPTNPSRRSRWPRSKRAQGLSKRAQGLTG